MSKTNFKKPRKKNSLGNTPDAIENPKIQNLHKKPAGAAERIHILVSPEKKQELKIWAAMHKKDMTTIILEGLELWKEANAT